jgi:hypothetical protein
MLNRSTIAISVDSFIRAQTFRNQSRFPTTEPIVSS